MTNKIALLAGGGVLPECLLSHWQKTQRPHLLLAFKGQTPLSLLENHPHLWTRFGSVGRTLQLLKKQGVKEVVLAGQMTKPKLWQVFPDMTALKILARLRFSLKGDNRLLIELMRELESNGFVVRGAHEILHDLLLSEQCLTLVKPDSVDRQNIKIGLAAAKAHGAADLGQAVLVENGVVLGREGRDGTNALIEKFAAHTKKSRAAILVKACKPQQDPRADLPTIGKTTVENALKAGLRGIVGEAGKTLFVEQSEAMKIANQGGVFVLGAHYICE